MRKRFCALLICLFLTIFSLFAASTGLVIQSPLWGREAPPTAALPLPVEPYLAQLGLSPEANGAHGAPSPADKVLEAISAARYPVTPGDVYRLSYTDGQSRITLDLQVDGSCQIDIPGIARVDASRLSLQSLREKILSLIRTYYSYASPSLTLVGTGSFSVSVVGEVESTVSSASWGLSRLSSVVSSASPYASTRSVRITSADGSEKTYDLYRAMRDGDLSQDPLLRPGDVVTLLKAEKLVTLSGSVRHEGTFQVHDGETLSEIITRYGGGVLPGADIQHIRIRRFSSPSWRTLYVNLLDEKGVPPLISMDQIMIDRVAEKTESMTIEGAVTSREADNPSTSAALMGQSSGKLFYQFYPGETLDQMVETVSGRLMSVSDLEKAYLLRDGKRVPVNLSRILSGNGKSGITLEKDDCLTIPFTQRFVTVTGAITRSGVYAFVPDKNADYYIALAGGPTTDAAVPTKVTVTDREGKKLGRDIIIPEESTINIRANTFVKNLAPTVAIIGLVSSVVSIVASIVQMSYQLNK